MPKPSEFPFKTVTGQVYDSGNYQAALKKAAGVGRLAEAPQGTRYRSEGGPPLWHRAIDLRRDLRARAVEDHGRGRMGMGLRPDRDVRQSDGDHWRHAARPGTGDELRPDRGRSLGIPIDDIVVLSGDTATAHYGRDTYGSRATALGGTAIVMSIDKIMEKAKTLAAALLKSTPKKVEFMDGKFFVKDNPKNAIGWGQLASEAYVAKNLPPGFEPGLEASSFFEPPNCTFPFGTHIVAVEVDRETGQVKIRNMWPSTTAGNR